jgi:hypothetical protein
MRSFEFHIVREVLDVSSTISVNLCYDFKEVEKKDEIA